MSKKSKLIIGIILLAVGGGLVPTGYFVNNYLIEQVYEGVPTALLKIQDDALPSLEEQIPVLATPDVLLGIEDQALNELESQLPGLATPQVLAGLKDEAVSQLPAIINGSGAAKAINGTIDYAALVYGVGYPTAKDDFFNSNIFSTTYPGLMQGVSEYTGVPLSYTVAAQDFLLYGNGPMPGLITDLDLGLGVLGYMELYLNASLGDLVLQGAMQLYYNATWGQLSALAGYVSNYLWEVVVKSTYAPAPIELVAEMLFYEQWANGTVVEDGIDLSLFKDGVPPDTYGLEAGIPNPTNLTVLTCMDLWDDSELLSFTNDTGIMVWIYAMQLDLGNQTALMMSFGISPAQLTILLGWLGAFIITLTPLLVEVETGYTIPELAQFAFYEQWTNGTIQGKPLLPGGFLAELSPLFAGPPYFEVGIPTPSGLSLSITTLLWNVLNPYSFVNGDGVLIWVGAALGNTTLQFAIQNAFFLSPIETNTLITWFGSFLSLRVPQILFYETGTTSIPQLAQYSFYEQWSNGTILGKEVLPDGILSERDPPYFGPPYFEIALTLESPANLSILQCILLWNEASNTSLVTVTGINKWYDAKAGNTMYTTLAAANGGLTNAQMDDILEWLPLFRDKVVNTLAEDEENLPMKPYALGNTIFIGLGAAGGALAVLGVVFLILSKRSL